MKTIQLSIEGMTCGGCAKSVANVLLEQKGVQEAQVSHADKLARIVFDEAQVTPSQLVAVIEEAGFDVVNV